jgi:hypothetical protein
VAGVVYALVAAGQPFWLAATLAFLLFFFTNGLLAYWGRARLAKQRGEAPPPLKFMFFPKPVSVRDKVAMPRPLRVALGMVLLAGGALFAIAGIGILIGFNPSSFGHPTGALFALLVLAALGVAIGYVGIRLMVVKDDDRLLWPARTAPGPE